MFFLLYRHANAAVFDDFSKIFKICSEGEANVSEYFPNIFEHFSKITEDCRRRAKKIRRRFDHIPINIRVVRETKEKCYL